MENSMFSFPMKNSYINDAYYLILGDIEEFMFPVQGFLKYSVAINRDNKLVLLQT